MLSKKLYKYSGAGNDFIVLYDDGNVSEYRGKELIEQLCDRKSGFKAADGRIGSDGLIILSNGSEADFNMEFFNPDGSSGMMCGNGGRCVVAFADLLGIKPKDGNSYRFLAADGMHKGEILSHKGNLYQIRISMIDAFGFKEVKDGYFLNTGTRHFVKFVPDAEAVDVEKQGPLYRHDAAFAPQGTNVSFVSLQGEGKLRIRTFEKGVEAETLACGTGITASAIAAYYAGIGYEKSCNRSVSYTLQAQCDKLSVDFIPVSKDNETIAREVYLTGPVEIIL